MMNMKDLQFGLETAFIDYRTHSNLAFRPEFVSNDSDRGKRVISSIEEELLKCDEFSISVAFITLGGITPLLQVLKELETRGIRGRILEELIRYLDGVKPGYGGIFRMLYDGYESADIQKEYGLKKSTANYQIRKIRELAVEYINE